MVNRQRMYLFESAYVDYGARLREFRSAIGEAGKGIWDWFWSKGGAQLLEVLVRLAAISASILLAVEYYRYEDSYHRVSTETYIAIGVIFLFAVIILWGWKGLVHFVVRLVSAVSASTLIVLLGTVALGVALAVFAPYLLILFVLTALSFLVFVPIRFIHWLWLIYRRITYRCPYDDDGQDHGLPIHICSCGQEYDDLQPSFYGIFYHTCRHKDGTKQKLPTMDWWGRNKLLRLCRGCRRQLTFSSLGELPDRPIAIIGGPSAGKSVFLRQAARGLCDRLGAIPGAKVQFDSKVQQAELQKDLETLDRGEVLAKTAGEEVRALGLAVRIPKGLRSLLYLYDAPGEHFLTVDRFGRKQVIRHLAGIIVIVDPFTFPALSSFAQKWGDQLKPSSSSFHDDVSVLINGVNQMLVRMPTEKCKVPVAVILAKADAYPTKDLPVLADLISRNGQGADESLGLRCRSALEDLGEGRSIRILEQKFTQVRYFACSALGRMPDPKNTGPFQPAGVVEPLLWLMGLDGKTAKAA